MKFVMALLGALLMFTLSAGQARAIVDPLGRDNNKVGVHILQPGEIEEAAKLVNGKDGQWGYVTVPIQTTDRNRRKWGRFMRKARELKVIPIIRIATLVEEVNWEEPENLDLIAFANFLNDLEWPIKNRYVVVFNEVNRSDEFGGKVKPEKYADILVNTVRIFKQRSEDFFMLPAGLDLAADDRGFSMNWRDFWLRAYEHNSQVFEVVDGWTSHSYPNPGFVGKPSDLGAMSISGFEDEAEFVSRYRRDKLPVFITETGWDADRVGAETVAEYYRYGFERVWSKESVVTVTPFLLHAGGGLFKRFSLLDGNYQPTLAYEVIAEKAKTGQPVMASRNGEILGASTQSALPDSSSSIWQTVKEWWVALLRLFDQRGVELDSSVLKVGGKTFKVEMVRSEDEQRKGLADRENLNQGTGMWFVFDERRERSFWMKGVGFDIDMVWIRDGQVVGVSRGDHTRPYKTYLSHGRVDSVLEVSVDAGIEVGDRVTELN